MQSTFDKLEEYVSNQIRNAKEMAAEAKIKWLSGSSIAERAWSYLPTIAKAEATVALWQKVSDMIAFRSENEDNVDWGLALREMFVKEREQFMSTFHVPSSTSQISNVVDSIQMEVRVAWLERLENLAERFE